MSLFFCLTGRELTRVLNQDKRLQNLALLVLALNLLCYSNINNTCCFRTNSTQCIAVSGKTGMYFINITNELLSSPSLVKPLRAAQQHCTLICSSPWYFYFATSTVVWHCMMNVFINRRETYVIIFVRRIQPQKVMNCNTRCTDWHCVNIHGNERSFRTQKDIVYLYF